MSTGGGVIVGGQGPTQADLQPNSHQNLLSRHTSEPKEPQVGFLWGRFSGPNSKHTHPVTPSLSRHELYSCSHSPIHAWSPPPKQGIVGVSCDWELVSVRLSDSGPISIKGGIHGPREVSVGAYKNPFDPGPPQFRPGRKPS